MKYLLSMVVLPAIVLSLVSLGEKSSAANPTIRFSFYAPVQKDSPVRIVGFEHDKSDVLFVLSNVSDKPVMAVMMGRVDIVPTGCALEAAREDMAFMSVGGAGFKISLPPHGNAIVSRAGIFPAEGGTPKGQASVHYPRLAVSFAKRAGAVYMQVQFGITGVYFENGSVWPPGLDRLHPGDPPGPFDPELAKSKAGDCTDVATVASALKSVEDVEFGAETPYPDHLIGVTGIPQLHFSCSLEGPKAVCRLPLETNHAPALPGAVKQN